MDETEAGLKVFIANVLGVLFGIVGLVYFAQTLGAKQFGIIVIFQSLLAILDVPIDLGIRMGIEKRISEGTDQGRYLSTGLLLKVIPLTVASLIILVFSSAINQYIGGELAGLLVLGIILRQVYYLIISVLNGERRVGQTAPLLALNKLIYAFGGILLINVLNSYEGVILSILLGYAATSAWGIIKINTNIKYPSASHVYSIFDFSKYGFISSIGGNLHNWLDAAIIGVFLSQAFVGAYEVSWRVANMPLLLSNAVAAITFPQVSYWSKNGEWAKIESFIPRAIVLSVVLVLPSFFGIAILSDEILRLVFGPQYSVASSALIIIAAYMPIKGIQRVISASLLAIDKPDLAAKATAISVLLNILLNVLLVPPFGILGAAIATVFSSLISDGLHWYYLSSYIDVEIRSRLIALMIAVSALMAGLILGVKSFLRIGNVYYLILTILFGAIVYTAILLVNGEVRSMLNSIVGEHIRDILD